MAIFRHGRTVDLSYRSWRSEKANMLFDSLARLVVFAEVVEAGSIAEAARRLGIVKSALSERLTDLEASLGVKLLERSARGVRPTEAGALILGPAKGIRREGEIALAALREAEAPRGTLRISIPAGIADRLVLPALARFLGDFPGISLDVVATDAIVDLDEARVDVALRLGWIDDGRFIARPLRRLERVVFASPAYLARAGTPSRPSDLEGHDWIGFAAFGRTPSLRFTGTDGTMSEVMLACRVHTTSAHTLRSWALEGVGVTHMPDTAVSAEIASGALVRVLADWQLPAPTLYVVYRPERYRPANAKRLIDFLVAAFR
jgi:DNA-binding transcriptional LysR family regulator